MNKPLIGMDGLRALACLAVFGVHWQQLTGVTGQLGPIEFGRLLENGNTGVALFMILSGMLLARPWLASHSHPRQPESLIRYFRNRAGRILPAYWVCLGTLAILGRYWQTPSQWMDVAAHFLFLHNLSTQTLYSINPPFWALAVIVQFYVVFGVLMSCLKWAGWQSTYAILSVSVFIALVCQLSVALLSSIEPTSEWNQAWVGLDPILLDHSLLSHLSLFNLGVVAAAIESKLTLTHSHWFDALVIICVGLVLTILATPLDDLLQVPGGRYNFPFIPLLLTVIVLASSRSDWIARILETFPLRRLGIVSYGFYLFHLPIMKAILKVASSRGIQFDENPFLFAIASFSITVLVSELSFQWLETPFGNWIRMSRD